MSYADFLRWVRPVRQSLKNIAEQTTIGGSLQLMCRM